MKHCETCGAEFSPTREWSKYCSAQCRNNNPTKKKNTASFQKARRDRITEIKLSSGCVDCGYRAHPAALDFDHVRGEKLFNISQDPKRAWEDILTEIDKCEIVCSNCHRIRTYERKQHSSRHRNKRAEAHQGLDRSH